MEVHVVELIGVEDVGGEKHGEQQDDPGCQGDSLDQSLDLCLPAGVLHQDDLAAVVANDAPGIAEQKGESSADEHEHNEADVGPVVDRGGAYRIDILAERHQRPDDGSEIEDDPEPGYVPPLLVFGRIAHHDGSLGRPQQTGADTEERSRKDDESAVLVVIVAQKAGRVDAVSEGPKSQCWFHSKDVGDGAREEGDHGKGGIEGRVGVVLRAWINLPGGTETGESVEHTGAQEANHGYHQELDDGRREPHFRLAQTETFVHPSRRSVDGAGRCAWSDGRRLDGLPDFLLFLRHLLSIFRGNQTLFCSEMSIEVIVHNLESVGRSSRGRGDT